MLGPVGGKGVEFFWIKAGAVLVSAFGVDFPRALAFATVLAPELCCVSCFSLSVSEDPRLLLLFEGVVVFGGVVDFEGVVASNSQGVDDNDSEDLDLRFGLALAGNVDPDEEADDVGGIENESDEVDEFPKVNRESSEEERATVQSTSKTVER